MNTPSPTDRKLLGPQADQAATIAPPNRRAERAKEASAAIKCKCGSEDFTYIEDVPAFRSLIEQDNGALVFCASAEMNWEGCHNAHIVCTDCGTEMIDSDPELIFR